jgi:phage baseplate assembly protein V
VSAELLRRLNNIVNIGTVTESKSVDGLALARVKVGARVTDFLPFMQQANSFKRSASPVRVGEQVMVLSPYGDGDFGVILGGIFNKGAKEPNGYSADKEVCKYEDGTTISYDVVTSTLDVNAVKNINITCKNATVVADNISVTATTTHTGNVSIVGNLSVNGTVSSTGDISTDANVNDVKGSLTNFSTTDGAGRA